MSREGGFRLRIPKEAVPLDQPPTELQVTASLTGQYAFPEDCELVSGVYCISFPLEFLKPVTLDIWHCLHLTCTSQCSSLSFVVAKSNQKGLPYRFDLIEGGSFVPTRLFGSLKFTQSSLWGIVRSFRRPRHQDGEETTQSQTSAAAPMDPARKGYTAQLFYRRNSAAYSWTLHLVIIPNLPIWRTVSHHYPFSVMQS